jgi:hypothetical protein
MRSAPFAVKPTAVFLYEVQSTKPIFSIIKRLFMYILSKDEYTPIDGRGKAVAAESRSGLR